MRESRRRRRVCQVIGRHIDCLYGCDGTIFCRSDTLLQSTHLCLKGRLVTYGRRHTSKQRGNLRTGLRKTENIVNEKKHVLSTLVTEIFRHCKTCQTNPHSGSGRLVHLTEYHGGLADNAGLRHFIVKVISLSGTLAYACKYGESVMLVRNVCDKLLNKNRLSYTGAAKQTNLTASLIRAEKVNDLDSCLKHLCGCRLLLKGRRGSVNRLVALCFRSRFVIYRFAKYVEHTSKCAFTNGNRNRCTCRNSVHPSYKSVRRPHGDTSYRIITQMLRNFDCQLCAVASCNFNCVIQLRKLSLAELHIKNRTDNLGNFTNYLICHLFVSSLSNIFFAHILSRKVYPNETEKFRISFRFMISPAHLR